MDIMTAAVIDATALNHLGAVVNQIRQDWDPPGIRAALETALGKHPYADVALVAVSSARDPRAATPGVIPTRCANGWTSTPNDEIKPPTHTAEPFKSLRCPKCEQLIAEGEEEHRRGNNCGGRASPEQIKARRAEIAAERQPTARFEKPETEETDSE